MITLYKLIKHKMETLEEFFNKTIYHWVGKNFGSKEADDPSWNIEALSKYLAKEMGRREQKILNLEPYELTVLLHEACDTGTSIAHVVDIVERFGGRVISSENEGRKRLAYKINNEEFAQYIYMNIELPKDAPVKISTTLNTTDVLVVSLLEIVAL